MTQSDVYRGWGIYRPHLTDKQLRNLNLYKYRGEDRSITYRYLLAPMYTRLVEYIPLWVAPNLVTFVGFILPTITHFLLLYHSPTLEGVAPRWMYLFAAFSLFAYMVLDNLDGKQARRTSSSSPLGHLFDHGCDALNVTVSGVVLLASVRLSPPIIPLSLIYGLGHLMFYMAALEEYHTGRMVLRELNGPNEGLLTLCLMQLVTALLGPSLWTLRFGAGPPFNYALYILSFLPIMHSVVGNLCGIVAYHRACRTLSLRTVGALCSHLVPIVALGAIQFSVAVLAPKATQAYIVPLLWQTGLVTYDAVTRIMLATLTHSPFPSVAHMLFPMALAYLAALLSQTAPNFLPLPFETFVIYSCLSLSIVYSVWRTYCITTQITQFLNIRCFSLRPLRSK